MRSTGSIPDKVFDMTALVALILGENRTKREGQPFSKTYLWFTNKPVVGGQMSMVRFSRVWMCAIENPVG